AHPAPDVPRRAPTGDPPPRQARLRAAGGRVVPHRAPGPLLGRHRHRRSLPALRASGRRRDPLPPAYDPTGRSLEGALGRVRVAVIDTPRGLEPIALARAAWRLTRFFRGLKPDLVHTHSSVPGALGRIAARAAGVPIVVHTVHGFHFHQGSRLPSKLYSLAT